MMEEKVYKTDNATLKLELPDADKLIDKRKIGLYSDGQKYVDSEVLRLSNVVCPKLEGDLINSSILSTEIGSGKVVYNTPYAAKQYYNSYEHREGRRDHWIDYAMDNGGKRSILEGLIKITGGSKK